MTGYYQELADEIGPQLVPILRPNYRFFPGREKEHKKQGRGWYRRTGAGWEPFEGMSGVIADHYRAIALRLMNATGLSEKRRCRALLSCQATAAAVNFLKRVAELHFNYENVPFPYALSQREICALVLNGTLPTWR